MAGLHTSAGLIQHQHAWFLWTLIRHVGALKAARLSDGQQWEQTFQHAGVDVALSDTARNTKTDKLGKRHSYGTFTIEYLSTAPACRHRGAANALVTLLAQLADHWNITLRLRPLAQAGGPLDDAQLTAWYGRLGFTGQDGLYLSRAPRQRSQSVAE